MYKVAIGWWTWELTQSTSWLGVVAFADTFPMVIMSIVAGVWADKYGYLLIIRLSQSVMVAAGFLIAYLALTNELNILWIVVLTIFIGTAEAITAPARISLVHQLVPKTDLSAAIALNSATYNLARFLGPTIAGALIVWVSIPSVIALSAGTFTIYFCALFFITVRHFENQESSNSSMFRDFIDGLKYVRGHSGILFLLFLLAVTALLIRPYIDLLPGVSEKFFSSGAEGLSVLLAATGLGATMSGLWLAQRGRTEGLTGIFALSLIISAVAILFFTISRSIWLGTALAGILGFSIISGAITGQTLIQNAVEATVRARIISLTIMLAWGLPAVGALVMGWIAEYLGLALTLGLGGTLTILLWLWAKTNIKRMALILES